jgi:hypothetical protein
MRVDVCGTDEPDSVAALLVAIAAVGAVPEDADFDAESPLGVGLHAFRTPGGDRLTVYADAWGVDLEGPDALVRQVTEHMIDAGDFGPE